MLCNNVIKSENFVPLNPGYLKAGFWRFDTFLRLPSTYTPSSTYLGGLVLPAPAVGSVPLYMFYRSPSLLYFGPLPYEDEVYYSTVPDAPAGMRIADDYPDGIVGYVYTSGAPDRVPVYEFYNATSTNHLWSNAAVA